MTETVSQQEPDPIEAIEPTYLSATRTGTYGFLSAIPLILMYETLIISANEGRVGQVRVSSELWLKQWFQFIDGPTTLIMGGVLLVVGFCILMYERKKRIPLRPAYFFGIVIESGFYAIIVALLVSQLVWSLFSAYAPTLLLAGAQLEQETIWMQLALSIGAGIYEELLFRVILVGGLYAILKAILGFQTAAYIVAAVAGALMFSGIHYMGPLGDDFTAQSFLFRFFFGLALNVIYLVRGFGVAAWTHALYDVMIVTKMLG
ncbi:MAG: CPBP family intramembrane glutamic endopeptidase [Bacteroidota bacterium]